MIALPSLLAWSALALVLTMLPGPDTLLVVGHAARRGVRAGMAAVAGILVGGLWYMALCGFGFLSVLVASTALFEVVRIVGAAYLAYLGGRMLWTMLRPQAPSAEGQARPVAHGSPFRQGLISNVANPKIALFYLAVLPQFVGHDATAPMRGVLLIAIHYYVIGGLWLTMIAFAAGRGGAMVRQSSAMRWIEGTLGIAFVGFAGKLALSRN